MIFRHSSLVSYLTQVIHVKKSFQPILLLFSFCAGAYAYYAKYQGMFQDIQQTFFSKFQEFFFQIINVNLNRNPYEKNGFSGRSGNTPDPLIA